MIGVTSLGKFGKLNGFKHFHYLQYLDGKWLFQCLRAPLPEGSQAFGREALGQRGLHVGSPAGKPFWLSHQLGKWTSRDSLRFNTEQKQGWQDGKRGRFGTTDPP